MTNREDVYAAISREREYQIRKYGDDNERNLTIIDYFSIILDELHEAEREASVDRPDAFKKEMLQVAAVIVAMLEVHGVVEREGA